MSDQNLCERFTETMARFTELTAKRLPDDVVTKLEELRKEQKSELANIIYDTMFANQDAALRRNVPSCQDTGVIQYFIQCGSKFPLLGDIPQCLPEAAKRATTPTAPHRPPEQLVQPMSQDSWWVWLGVAAVAIYSGYFGAGAGTLALAVLDAAKIGPFHKINALKTLIGTGANISASVVFIIQGAVDWPAAIMLCIGCFIGGYIAPSITRKIPANIMRAAAVIAGIILTIDLGLKTY